MGDALELRLGGHTTVRRHGAIAAERQRLDFGEENRILRTTSCETEEGEGEEAGDSGGDHDCGSGLSMRFSEGR